jgi:hypothetical protein
MGTLVWLCMAQWLSSGLSVCMVFIVEPAIAAIIYVNVEANLQFIWQANKPNVLTTGPGHFLHDGRNRSHTCVPYFS